MFTASKSTSKDGTIHELETNQIKVLLLENVSEKAQRILKEAGFQVIYKLK